MRRAAIACCALLAASCVSARWSRTLREERIAEEATQRLEIGRSDLAECLALLGAPLEVWELPAGAFALAYAWGRDRGLGATVSVPTSSGLRPSYRYDQGDANLHGLVLLFDREGVLELVRRGYLHEIAPELARPRPASLEDIEDADEDR